MEQRGAEIEVRAKGRRLEGHAALFGVETRVAGPRGPFRETIRAGAFAASLRGRDVLALRDHDPGRVLARTRSGTLRLAEDSTGLQFEIALADTTEARDVLAMVERGDAGGMSFAFDAEDEDWQGDRRELRSVVLHEISVVSAWPAYPGTIVQARAGGPGAPSSLALARLYLDTLRG
ncbi:HK97 family phage prohead protease [Methylorubrum suomiense]|uniref:Prohead serine protease domain-containing protein n=1 Tax=Methylorubrum suomiense TaxID=144191 RepID=A0ABQ4V6Y7_9HYPH|nr:HK97 family phage prohead protease [Methylorubrum suomiense]GJE78647.1 hypothetical protein BGCPKDLD_5265 [Methylorubrum suomiense]